MHEAEGSPAVKLFFCLGNILLGEEFSDLFIGGFYESGSAEVDDFADLDIDACDKLFDLIVDTVGVDRTSQEEDVNILLKGTICGQCFDSDSFCDGVCEFLCVSAAGIVTNCNFHGKLL